MAQKNHKQNNITTKHMNKIVDMFLTKEAFEQYAKRLREEQAREHGMTLEEWDAAILEGKVVTPNTQWNGPTSSFNG